MEEKKLKFTHNDQKNLLETARRGKFLRIVDFVFSGINVLILLLFMGGFGFNTIDMNIDMNQEISKSILGFIYLLLSLFYIFPSLFVYRFSFNILHGIYSDNHVSRSSVF